MLLIEKDIEDTLEIAKAAFPYHDWQFHNEVNAEYGGFSMWGKFTLNARGARNDLYFITFDIYKDKWQGSLSVGQHMYYWSSSSEEDSCLIITKSHDSLETTITELKTEITRLFTALTGVTPP